MKKNIYTCRAESLCCTPETNTTLQTYYIAIKKTDTTRCGLLILWPVVGLSHSVGCSAASLVSVHEAPEVLLPPPSGTKSTSRHRQTSPEMPSCPRVYMTIPSLTSKEGRKRSVSVRDGVLTAHAFIELNKLADKLSPII